MTTTKANVQPVDFDTYYQDAIHQSGEALKSSLNKIVKGPRPSAWIVSNVSAIEEAVGLRFQSPILT